MQIVCICTYIGGEIWKSWTKWNLKSKYTPKSSSNVFFVLHFLEKKKKKYRPRRETTCKGWALCDCRTRTNQQGLVYCKCMLPHSCLCHIAIQILPNSNLSEKVFYLEEYNDTLTHFFFSVNPVHSHVVITLSLCLRPKASDETQGMSEVKLNFRGFGTYKRMENGVKSMSIPKTKESTQR